MFLPYGTFYWNKKRTQQSPGITELHIIKCQMITRQTRLILNAPSSLCLLIWPSQEELSGFDSLISHTCTFSVHLPLSSSLEMFHDDVGTRSTTADEFAPGREKQKERMLLLYQFCITKSVKGICKFALAVVKLFEENQ